MNARWMVLLSVLWLSGSRGQGQTPVTPFSTGGLEGWEEQTFKRVPPTHYDLVQEDGRQVLHARSAQGASGRVFKQDLDVEARPMLSWSWKVNQMFAKPMDEQTREGDDYVLRVYVVFRTRWNQIKPNTLVYVWSRNPDAEPGYVSPYTDLARMIPVNRGEQGLGEWQSHRRNVQDDIQTWFGEKIKKILAIAVMTDGDSSGQNAEAWYGDIALSPAK